MLSYLNKEINMLGGTIENVLNQIEKRSDINFSAIRGMGCHNLLHHHIVI